MSRQTLNLTAELYEYLRSVSLREPFILKQLREETAGLEWGNMQISPEQGQFMQLIVSLLGAKKILEVGTFTGYSALSMAMALPEDGNIICCDTSEEWTDIARRYWDEAELADKIKLYLAPATETLQSLLDQGQQDSFDMVFIDADKENYQHYYEFSLRLVRKNGLIMFDNTLWNGAVIEPDNTSPATLAIRDINKIIFADDRIDISLLPIGDGLTLVRKL